MNETKITTPADRLAGLKENWKQDIISGFILFLIALPLSLGIAMASGMPPLAGIIAAVVGGMVVSQISGSYVTINGPAAGLIVVILGAVESLGGGAAGYHAALAACVVSGLILFVLGLCKTGELGYFFPSSVVHGMLAAIGIIIMTKQMPFLLGVRPPAKEPLQLIARIPDMLLTLNPEIALIGIVSLIILIAHACWQNKLTWLKRIPAPIIVVAFAVALGQYFDLEHAHAYALGGHQYALDPKKFLVVLPNNVLEGITHPDFSKIGTGAFWLAVMSITLIQGVETVLSCAAVDKLDVFRRRADLSRDLAAVGFGSAVSASIGGLPMIAEIVRSTANVANGARTRWSNFFHGVFMLVFVLLGASLIDQIPLAALAALLVFTGYRLSSPKVFRHTHEIGPEQLALFLLTVVTTLATDLLIGVAVGVTAKLLLHLLRGAPIKHLFSADISVEPCPDGSHFVQIRGAAIFSNYLSIKKHLDKLPRGGNVRVDLSNARLVDHTVMDNLHHFQSDYNNENGHFTLMGLDGHDSASLHPLASRRLSGKHPSAVP
jgi:MFS superfamily sulfate permease-like transporter